MKIRDGELSDLEDIARLVREFAEYIGSDANFTVSELSRGLFEDEAAANVILAESDAGEIAGYALWHQTFSSFRAKPGIWIEDLFVRDAFRGQGFGAGLVAELRGRADGKLTWSIRPWNDKARHFYEALGAIRDDDVLYFLE